ncbi:hypothetical protein [Nostoc sp. CMAA1605]|uniref:hypothetical protein n=1 Tax=Nostoc sp. CMAA1605 TaxID=2055159 RepID=UPI001F38FFAA|nr:hypothetical protein [Nostoc sp. CMAA1605]
MTSACRIEQSGIGNRESGQGGQGGQGRFLCQCPIPNSQCPIPNFPRHNKICQL